MESISTALPRLPACAHCGLAQPGRVEVQQLWGRTLERYRPAPDWLVVNGDGLECWFCSVECLTAWGFAHAVRRWNERRAVNREWEGLMGPAGEDR